MKINNFKTGILILLFVLSIFPMEVNAMDISINWGNAEDELGFYNKNVKSYRDEGEPSGPSSLFVDDMGNFYITDTFNKKIKKFSISGRFLESIGTKDPCFDYLLDIKVVDGIIYFIDGEKSQIIKYQNNKIIARIGGYGKDNGKFVQPHQIEIGPDGKIYVGDRGKLSIEVFSNDGKYLMNFPWNLNSFSITDNNRVLIMNYEEKKGYTVNEYNPQTKSLVEKFSVGNKNLTRAGVTGIDKSGYITCRFSYYGTNNIVFQTFNKKGKKIKEYEAQYSTDVREACIMSIGKIFCLQYDSFTAPLDGVIIHIE